MALLSIGNDAKTVKGVKYGYQTAVLYLAPHTLSGRNLCPNASPGCIATCLNTAGRGVFNNVQTARVNKTHTFTNSPAAFVDMLAKEIRAHVASAKRRGLIPLVRLNGTSDLPWENLRGNTGAALFAQFPDVQFYDYTKSWHRAVAFTKRAMPVNYHLTFSRSECNDTQARDILRRGGNVAVVFDTRKGSALPSEWQGYRVVDGDVSDVRHNDDVHAQGATSINVSGVVIGLRAKGKARRDVTGFVVKAGG